MAYAVSQLRKNENLKYMTTLQIIERKPFQESNPFNTDTYQWDSNPNNFIDLALNSPTVEGNTDTGFLMNQVYYLRFKIRCIFNNFYSNGLAEYPEADILKISILLKNSSLGQSTQVDDQGYPVYQQIGSCEVKKSVYTMDESITEDNIVIKEPEYINFSMIFSPLRDGYDSIVFRVNRDKSDILQARRNWMLLDFYQDADSSVGVDITTDQTQSRNEVILTDNERAFLERTNYSPNIFICERVNNLGVKIDDGDLARLNDLVAAEGKGYWTKIGYQSRPGSLIVVNKQPIRVGRSGIYELDNGLKITDFMIAGPNGSDVNNLDSFLLDFAYEE